MTNITNAEIILNHIFPEPKHPKYRGAENVEFIWNGTQSDPQLRYDGKLFNYWDIEDVLWDMFTEDNPDLDVSGEWADDAVMVDAMFDKFVQERCEEYLEDVIFGGYFES